MVRVNDTIDLGLIGLTAARLSGSGIGIGLQGKGTALIHRRDLPPLANLELYSVAPTVDARALPAARRQRRPARQGRHPGAGPQPVQRRGDRGALPHQGGRAGGHRARLQRPGVPGPRSWRWTGERRSGASGRDPAEVTLEAVREGAVDIADLRIHPDTLEHQARGGRGARQPAAGRELPPRRRADRAADDEVLALYEALRPYRSTAAELHGRADLLEARGARATRRCSARPRRSTRDGGCCAGEGGRRGRRREHHHRGGRSSTRRCRRRCRWLRDRAPTRGHKGSAASLHGAVTLVRRLERRLGRGADLVAAAPQRPVDTRAVSLPEAPPATGRLEVVRAGGATPGRRRARPSGAPQWADAPPAAGTGTGGAAGPHGVRVSSGPPRPPGRGPRPAPTCAACSSPTTRGCSSPPGWTGPLPVADEVDVVAVAARRLVAVEVRAPGHPLQDLVDPIRLSACSACDPDERGRRRRPSPTLLGDVSRGVVALRADARGRAGHRRG